MSVNRNTIRQVVCDHPHCNCEPVERVNTTDRDVRSLARKLEWRCDGTGDWCPSHANPLTLTQLVARAEATTEMLQT